MQGASLLISDDPVEQDLGAELLTISCDETAHQYMTDQFGMDPDYHHALLTDALVTAGMIVVIKVLTVVFASRLRYQSR